MTWTHVFRCTDAEHPDMRKWGAGSATVIAYDSTLTPEEAANGIRSRDLMYDYVTTFDHEPTDEELEALDQ